MPLLDPEISAKMSELQALDDAIAFRLGRLKLACPACAKESKCVEHAQDESLIEAYQERYAAVFQDALAGMDPEAIELIMRPGDDVPPTVAMLSPEELQLGVQHQDRLSRRQGGTADDRDH